MLISQLSAVTTLAAGDNIVVQSAANNDARKASLSVLLAWFEANFASPEFETVITAPTSSGFNLQLTASTSNIWAIVNPTGAFAAATITLPPVADAFDGQQIVVTCSAAITALTLAGNGATIVGGPTALGTGGFFALRLNALQDTWYCVSQSLGATGVFSNITVTNAILDTNGNELIKFSSTASAVNEVTIVNSATGFGATVASTGGDTNIDLLLVAKGTGKVFADGSEVLTAAVAATGTGSRVLAAGPTIGIPVLQAPVFEVTTFAAADALRVFRELSGSAQGMRAVISDAAATLASGVSGNTTVVGGGANIVPMFYNGTNWKYG